MLSQFLSHCPARLIYCHLKRSLLSSRSRINTQDHTQQRTQDYHHHNLTRPSVHKTLRQIKAGGTSLSVWLNHAPLAAEAREAAGGLVAGAVGCAKVCRGINILLEPLSGKRITGQRYLTRKVAQSVMKTTPPICPEALRGVEAAATEYDTVLC